MIKKIRVTYISSILTFEPLNKLLQHTNYLYGAQSNLRSWQFFSWSGKFSAFYAIPKGINVFISSPNISQLNPIETLEFHNFCTRCDIFLAFLAHSFKQHISFWFSNCNFISLRALHVPPIFYLSL